MALSTCFDGSRFFTRAGITSLTTALLMFVAGCGGGGGSAPSGSGIVTTTMSDPANACTAPNGPYAHVWVTVGDVTAHMSSSDSGPGVDLTPGLSSAPQQIDLLSASSTECVLATLGSTHGLAAGIYQQIRLILVANNASGVSLSTGANRCANASAGGFNCVVLAPAGSCSGSSNCKTLNLPSEATTGLKIPPGQAGGITVADGQQLDIDINFNACTSVVQAGNSGHFNLKPTLRAVELGTNPLTIQGQVVEANVTGTVNPGTTGVPNGNIWLEEQPASAPNFAVGNPTNTGASITVDAVVQTTQADSSGHFAFCAIGAGNYELAADAPTLPSSGLPSDATIATGVSVTSSGGPTDLKIPLVAQPSPAPVTPAWAQIVGEFTTTNSSAPGDDVSFGGVQPFAGASGTVQAIVPVLPSLSFGASAGDGNTFPNPPVAITGSKPQNCAALGLSSKCPAGANCECFELALPGGNPIVGTANSTGTGYNPPAGGPANYRVSGVATAIGTTTNVCSPSSMATNSFAAAGGAVTDTPTIPTLSYTGCD
jgi:hypothetical protein